MQGLVKEGLPFARDLSLENSADSYLCFQLALLHCNLLLFPISITFFIFVQFLILFYLAQMRFPRSTHLLMFLIVHHNDWLIYSGRTDQPGELCYNFSISNDLTQMVNFPTLTPGCGCHSPATVGTPPPPTTTTSLKGGRTFQKLSQLGVYEIFC